MKNVVVKLSLFADDMIRHIVQDGGHIHLWLIHVHVWQKPPQYCEVISLQLNKLIKKKENPKDATRELLKLINELGKVAGYKITTQKSHAFLHTNNERSPGEIKATIPVTTAPKRIKYLGTNLHKEQKTCTLKTVRR